MQGLSSYGNASLCLMVKLRAPRAAKLSRLRSIVKLMQGISEIDAARQFNEQIGCADLNNSNCRRQFVP
jgi:hypothetical protein